MLDVFEVVLHCLELGLGDRNNFAVSLFVGELCQSPRLTLPFHRNVVRLLGREHHWLSVVLPTLQVAFEAAGTLRDVRLFLAVVGENPVIQKQSLQVAVKPVDRFGYRRRHDADAAADADVSGERNRIFLANPVLQTHAQNLRVELLVLVLDHIWFRMWSREPKTVAVHGKDSKPARCTQVLHLVVSGLLAFSWNVPELARFRFVAVAVKNFSHKARNPSLVVLPLRHHNNLVVLPPVIVFAGGGLERPNVDAAKLLVQRVRCGGQAVEMDTLEHFAERAKLLHDVGQGFVGLVEPNLEAVGAGTPRRGNFCDDLADVGDALFVRAAHHMADVVESDGLRHNRPVTAHVVLPRRELDVGGAFHLVLFEIISDASRSLLGEQKVVVAKDEVHSVHAFLSLEVLDELVDHQPCLARLLRLAEKRHVLKGREWHGM